MKEYLPWSTKVLNENLSLHRKGKIASLDLDLTAKCSLANCIYCDSKPIVGKKQKIELDTNTVTSLIEEASLSECKWIYICGLGEPLEDECFFALLDKAYKVGVKVSVFTNALLINKENAKLLKKYNASLIVKLDTFNEQSFDKILGTPKTATKIYQAINLLLDLGFGRIDENHTNLALSIVPSSLNINDITEVIEFAIKNDIFPSIGELEQAGSIKNDSIYSTYSINHKETKELKNIVNSYVQDCYTRPFCPSIVTGVHIDSKGDCIVDKKTGLNCKWFLLKDPEMISLGNIKQFKLQSLFERVMLYRTKCFNDNKEYINEIRKIDYEFGGCGGSPKKIIKLAEESMKYNP